MRSVFAAARGRRSGWRQRFGIANTGTFHNGVDGVAGDVLQGFESAVGPTDFYGFHFGGGAQAEMEAKVVLGEVAAAAADFAELLNATGVNGDARPDGGAIAFCADQLEEHTVVPRAIGVEENGRRRANVEDDHVDVSGVEDVAESDAPAGL